MRRTVRALLRLTISDLLQIAASYLTATWVEIGLRYWKLPTLTRSLGVDFQPTTDLPAQATVDPNDDPHGSGRYPLLDRERSRIRFVRRVMRHWVFGDSCLRVALVAGHRIRHLSPELKVGVANVDGEIKAHAWLVVDGASLDPTGAAIFKAFEARAN